MFENEKIVEVKTCKHCSSSFEITDKDLEFYEKISPCFASPSMEGDGGGVKKYLIPAPTLCPDCRQQRRLSFRNERKLYKRICDATGKPIISMYSPDKPYKVFNQDFWWSDKWDALDYGRDFDFNRGFFEQFEELEFKVPKRNIINDNNHGSENCEYTNDFANGKDCYYCFETGGTKECFYCHHINNSEKVFDSDEVFDSNNCYECLDSVKLYNCTKLQESFNCSNCSYCFNINNCDNCFACSNINNKSFNILNIQYSKDEYEKILKENSVKIQIIFEYEKLLKNTIRKNILQNSSENVLGYNISYSSNILGYNIVRSKNSKFCINSDSILNCYDLQCWKSELCYEGISPDNGYNVCFGIWTWESKNSYYSFDCHNSSNLFGCIGLRNKSYCILNKQYTKEEYEELVPKIIKHMMKTGEWGEFFPSSISPFGYNETVAMEYFPLERRDVFEKHLYQDGKQNFKWSDYEPPFPKVDKIIKASMLPKDISQIPDDILNRAIECEITKKPFRIISQELEFYRKHNLPIPKRHPDQRHLDRMALRNPRKLFDRKCDKCGKDIKTTYSPDRKEIVYCEECYNREIY